MNHNHWQAKNRATIKERLAWLQQEPDGVLFQKKQPDHIVMVEKQGQRIQLALPCPVSEMTQSVLNLADPLHLIAPYNQAFMVALAWQSYPHRVLIGGVGGGSFPQVLHHYLPQTKLECVDLDPVVIEVAAHYFGFRPTKRLAIHQAELRHYIEQSERLYDLIFVDVFLGSGITPYPLVTQEFYQLCLKRLQPHGVLVLNIPHDESYFVSKLKTVQSVFKFIYLCRVEMGNSVLFATNDSVISRDELLGRCRALQTEHRFSFSLLKRAKAVCLPSELGDVLPDLYGASLLRDTTPPSDYLVGLPSMAG
ncbi:fused MFS/spermidine synthase [Anaerolineales bacterium HSG6]|nr:fused MFS/spermidine synthase [Anaerolineales bacterium HSG6]MDM8531825.1 fused MFS/spermidine synthase [Anaerolineales bacterium HSG25]